MAKNSNNGANLAVERDTPSLKGVLPKDYAQSRKFDKLIWANLEGIGYAT